MPEPIPEDQPIEHRAFQVRAVDADKREVSGVAVPWGQTADIGGFYKEIVARGAVVDSDAALLFWRHDEPIGRIASVRDSDAGWEITARISETARGDEAYTLLRDGVIDQFSIGFQPVEHTDEIAEDGTVTRTRTKIRVHEVSLVPFPAYEGAKVAQVRAAPTTTQKEPTMGENVTTADLTEIRQSIEDLGREVTLATTAQTPTETGPQFRSFGDYVKAVASGDEKALRAYEGATSGDTVIKDGWVQDLYRIMQERQRITSLFQHSNTLPSEGMNVEHGVVESDTTQVGVQVAEGDDLLYGKVAIGTRTAPVRTLGGWSSLSRQAIERTSVNVLDLTFTALANKYAKAIETLTRSTLTSAVANAAVVEGDLTDQDGVVTWLIDLVESFEDDNLNLDGVLVAKDVFLSLLAVPATDRILQVSTAPTDKLGTVTVRSLEGNIAGVKFSLLPGAAPGVAVGYDSLAIKTLESPGAPLRLQDENIVNLTKDFSVYGYAASYVQFADGLKKLGPVI